MHENEKLENEIHFMITGYGKILGHDEDGHVITLEGEEELRKYREAVKYLYDHRKELKENCDQLTKKLEYIKNQASKTTEQRLFEIEETLRLLRSSLRDIDSRTVGLIKY
jgi:chromosome segregation ATPase